jgi:hypothetical protein
MAKQRPADLAAYGAKYIVGKPHVTGVLISPSARRSLNLTTSDLAEPRTRP